MLARKIVGMTADAPPELRVLVIDDDVDAATSFSYVLQLMGCKTAVAFGGTTGLRVAELFMPNLAFVDLGMPGADGCEMLRAVKDLHSPVSDAMYVCLTGRGDPADERRCMEAGFDLFVTKPMDSRALAGLLTAARVRSAAAATSASHPSA